MGPIFGQESRTGFLDRKQDFRQVLKQDRHPGLSKTLSDVLLKQKSVFISVLSHCLFKRACPVTCLDSEVRTVFEKPVEELVLGNRLPRPVRKSKILGQKLMFRFVCKCPGCENGADVDRKKLLDKDGNVIGRSDPIWQSAETMVGDMEQFKKKRDWNLMKEAAQGWLARNFLPQENM